jgi:hypothetical protein
MRVKSWKVTIKDLLMRIEVSLIIMIKEEVAVEEEEEDVVEMAEGIEIMQGMKIKMLKHLVRAWPLISNMRIQIIEVAVSTAVAEVMDETTIEETTVIIKTK